MGTYDDLYDSYIKVQHIQDAGGEITLVIAGHEPKELGQGDNIDVKVVLSFEDESKEFALNKININKLRTLYGGDADGWVGETITLVERETTFQGKEVPCIRILA